MCAEGGNADFVRQFQAYSKDNQTADRNKVCQELADIDTNVNTEEQAWKKMANRSGKDTGRLCFQIDGEERCQVLQKKYETDVHAASNIRVNGNVYQMDELFDVFNITDGYFYVKKENRIHIW